MNNQKLADDGIVEGKTTSITSSLDSIDSNFIDCKKIKTNHISTAETEMNNVLVHKM